LSPGVWAKPRQHRKILFQKNNKNRDIILDYLDMPNVITKNLKSRRWAEERERRDCNKGAERCDFVSVEDKSRDH
jgi:hypothetical protein